MFCCRRGGECEYLRLVWTREQRTVWCLELEFECLGCEDVKMPGVCGLQEPCVASKDFSSFS